MKKILIMCLIICLGLLVGCQNSYQSCVSDCVSFEDTSSSNIKESWYKINEAYEICAIKCREGIK